MNINILANSKNTSSIILIVLILIACLFVIGYIVFTYSYIIVKKDETVILKKKDVYSQLNEGKYWIFPFTCKPVAKYKVYNNVKKISFVYNDNKQNLYNLNYELLFNITNPIVFFNTHKFTSNKIDFDIISILKNQFNKVGICSLENNENNVKEIFLKDINLKFSSLGVEIVDIYASEIK